MPQSTLPRFGLTDFLGTLPGGFYTLLVVYSLAHTIEVDLASSIAPLDSSGLLSTVIVFMASFLIGSIYRSVPVNWIAWDKGFPNSEHIQDCLQTLRDCSPAIGHIPDIHFTEASVQNQPIAKTKAMGVFDFWKAVICHLSPNAFNHIKSLEAKVRFFAGMVSAACICTLIGGVGLAANSWVWSLETWPLVCSPVLGVLCWAALRRARKEEVSEVVWSYVALLQNSSGSEATHSTIPRSLAVNGSSAVASPSLASPGRRRLDARQD
jgi:predicted membrane protein